MGRPPKDKDQLMNVPMRFVVTAKQKRLIDEAVRLGGGEFAEWARTILLDAARKQLARRNAKKSSEA
jgi:hypothetical protein